MNNKIPYSLKVRQEICKRNDLGQEMDEVEVKVKVKVEVEVEMATSQLVTQST